MYVFSNQLQPKMKILSSCTERLINHKHYFRFFNKYSYITNKVIKYSYESNLIIYWRKKYQEYKTPGIKKIDKHYLAILVLVALLQQGIEI